MAINVEGGGIKGGRAQVPGDISSQFISGLMFACPLAESNTTLTLTSPLESKSYVLMTQNVLSRYGVEVDIPEDFVRLKIPAGQAYRAVDQLVPGDFSSAAFLLAAAAVTDSAVQVKHLDYGTVQGDKMILRILKDMGVNGKVCKDQIEIDGRSGTLSPVDVDVRDVPDLVPVIAALACYANGSSIIREARRLRLKESDRLNSLHVELSKMGADIEVTKDSLTIKGPCPLHGAVIDPHRDHRIAMACAVAALGAEGETTITDSECVSKSYPRFFEDLKTLGVDIIGR